MTDETPKHPKTRKTHKRNFCVIALDENGNLPGTVETGIESVTEARAAAAKFGVDGHHYAIVDIWGVGCTKKEVTTRQQFIEE